MVTEKNTSERLAQRREAVLAAARRLFVERGFEEVTLSQVVARAGGSLATIYKLFGSKEGLLNAVVFERVQSGAELIRQIGARGVRPDIALKEIGIELQRRFLDPEDVALARIAITRSACDTDFARSFYECTHEPTSQALEALFTRWQEEGCCGPVSPRLLARLFLSILVEDLRSEMFYQSSESRLSCKEREQRIDFFLRGAEIGSRWVSCNPRSDADPT